MIKVKGRKDFKGEKKIRERARKRETERIVHSFECCRVIKNPGGCEKVNKLDDKGFLERVKRAVTGMQCGQK